jgi:hypothetical protein
MRILVRKPEGEVLPKGFAPCYPLFECRSVMCAPIGLHLLIRYVRAAYLWLVRVGWYRYVRWDRGTDLYHKGYIRGWNNATNKWRDSRDFK